jgi:hypothetical protein
MVIRIDYYYDNEGNTYLFPSQESTGFDFNSMMTGIMGVGVVGAMAGMFIPVNPEEEYRQLNERIRKLSFALESRRDSTISLRRHIYGSEGLLWKYGYQYVPPLVELKKHRDLRASLFNLEDYEKELARMETSMTLMQKRKKELAQKLGYREYEIEPRPHYTAMKKFTPPPGIGD